MKITVLKDEKTFDATAAARAVGQILSKPSSVIGLSTGRTTFNMHHAIAAMHTEHPFDISETTFFGVDEVMNVPREYFGACYTMLKNEMMDEMGVEEKNFIMLPTKSDDWDASCREYLDEINSRGGIDLVFLGLGENGHLGFNQPGSPFSKDAWATIMYPELEERISRETGVTEGLGGVTLGLKGIMNARRVILVAKGPHKAEIVKKMFESEITPDLPCTILRLHPDVEFIFDTEAASLINPENIK